MPQVDRRFGSGYLVGGVNLPTRPSFNDTSELQTIVDVLNSLMLTDAPDALREQLNGQVKKLEGLLKRGVGKRKAQSQLDRVMTLIFPLVVQGSSKALELGEEINRYLSPS